MDEKTQEKVSKVPLLGDIPVLGYLFRSTSNSTSKRNLMVFIRPTILRDADVYSGISSNKYSQFRSEQQEAAAQEGYLTSPKRRAARVRPWRDHVARGAEAAPADTVDPADERRVPAIRG